MQGRGQLGGVRFSEPECVQNCRGYLLREIRTVRGEHGGLVCHGPRWEASKPEVVYRGRELLWQPRFALTPGRSSVFRVIRKCSIIRDHCILSCTASSSRTKVPQTCTYALCLCQR
ncbi:uncharacterized protein LOC133665943 [Apis cerana]|uniref:uncharacterized protein LOC133665943 n=1 Tax=Apis cerana TaxID=7461 RepID=UPI002B22F870|nr:uncharacterized protein LOC133665943 [Apis cerana]